MYVLWFWLKRVESGWKQKICQNLVSHHVPASNGQTNGGPSPSVRLLDLSIYLSIDLSIWSIDLSIYPSIHLSIYLISICIKKVPCPQYYVSNYPNLIHIDPSPIDGSTNISARSSTGGRNREKTQWDAGQHWGYGGSQVTETALNAAKRHEDDCFLLYSIICLICTIWINLICWYFFVDDLNSEYGQDGTSSCAVMPAPPGHMHDYNHWTMEATWNHILNQSKPY